MEQLIKITEQDGNQVVSARELHDFLEVDSKFTDWCKRMFEYGFEEDIDYSLLKIGKRNAHNKIDYALTLDCAKEISMLQRSDKGKQARKYFIDCEKRLLYGKIKLPNKIELAKMLIESEEEKEQLEYEKQILLNENYKLQDKTALMDKVLDADEKIDIGQASKILELPFGRNTMFAKLREMGIFFKNRNEPKQEYIKRQYFVLKEKYISRNNHEGFVVVKVLVTQKGLEFLSSLFYAGDRQTKLAKLT